MVIVRQRWLTLRDTGPLLLSEGCSENWRPENFLEEVTVKPSWQRQGNGQGQGVWPDMAGGGAQPSLNFVLRDEGFLVGLSAGVQPG